MRIGVALPGSPALAGGGFTFEHEVLGGLLRAVPSSRHDFVFFDRAGTWSEAHKLPSNARHVSMQPAVGSLRQVLREDLVTNAVAALRGSSQPVGVQQRLKSALAETLLATHGVQCMLHLSAQSLGTSVPYVTIVWDVEHRVQPYFPEFAKDGEWARRESHYRRVLPRATAVVTGTETGRRQLESYFGVSRERILILPHPTPGDALACGGRTRPASPERARKKLLYPAQFWAHKNHVGLIHALQILAERYGERPELLLSGTDKGNRAHVEQLARQLRVDDQVTFLGFIERGRLLELYGEVDALVYPTTFGPENLPPLEAFALDCPVAASRVPGAEEQLGDCALLFDPHDHQAMAAAIHRILHDHELVETLRRRGRERARRWTGAHFADGLLEWFDKFATVRALWA